MCLCMFAFVCIALSVHMSVCVCVCVCAWLFFLLFFFGGGVVSVCFCCNIKYQITQQNSFYTFTEKSFKNKFKKIKINNFF